MRTIEIRTTQNVTIEYELAPMRERLLAAFIDLMIIGSGYIGLVLLLLSIFGPALDNSYLGLIVFGFLPVIGFMGYHFLFEWLGGGQSLGKRALGTKVLRLDGREPEVGDYLLRSFFLMVDGLFSLGILGILLIGSSPRNQRLGDFVAGTSVIRLRSRTRFRLEDILRIDSLHDFQPTYPEVQRLSEEDMLLVKAVINRYRLHRNHAHRQAVNELVSRLAELLEIDEVPRDRIGFLRTLLRDYIVLTR